MTPLTSALTAYTPENGLTIAPAAPVGTAPAGEVIDLSSARRSREADRRVSGWTCPECDLTAGPFVAAEATLLATVHDQVMGHPLRTAIRLIDVDAVELSDRLAL